MPDYKFVVFSNPVEGKDAEFNSWYDDVHLGEVVALPGFIGAKRFRVHPNGGVQPAHGYLAIYEMSTTDPQAVLTNLTDAAASGALRMSDTLKGDVTTMLVEQIAEASR
jgi:hypothetical protein